jgi:hypothetical protein
MRVLVSTDQQSNEGVGRLFIGVVTTTEECEAPDTTRVMPAGGCR